MGGYFVALVRIGFFRSGSIKENQNEFILSGRRLSLPGFIATLVTTWYGAILGIGENTYLHGIQTWLALPQEFEEMDPRFDHYPAADLPETVIDNVTIRMIMGEGYDLAIRAGTLQDSSLIARRISSRRLVTCGAPSYLDRYGTPDDPHSLVNYNCLVGTLGTWRFRQGQRNFDISVNGNWRSNNGRALVSAAKQGVGLVQLPDFYVTDDLEKGALVPVLESCNPTDTAVWAVYPHNRHLSAKVRLFVNYLAETLPD